MRCVHFFLFISLLFSAVTTAIPLSSRRSVATDLIVHNTLNRRGLTNGASKSSGASGSHSCPQSNGGASDGKKPIILGICAMDEKAQSKPMKAIQSRIEQGSQGAIQVKVFGDQVILNQNIQTWPTCDVLISFYSTGFPLDKATAYVNLRNPFCINDLPSQSLLTDRRHVYDVLDHLKVPTPRHLEVSRDGGPKISDDLKAHMQQKLGVNLGQPRTPPQVTYKNDAIVVNGEELKKPFVEKPVDGNDHNVHIYNEDGSGRRLHRKVGDKSSELVPDMGEPRKTGSYIYEPMVKTVKAEDVKVYTVGENYAHAETRKSPTVDGMVDRDANGKEIRGTTSLSKDETESAGKICSGFGQRVCGLDMLRCNDGKSVVIDVNGWSFVKGDKEYYDKAAKAITDLCLKAAHHPSGAASGSSSRSSTQH